MKKMLAILFSFLILFGTTIGVSAVDYTYNADGDYYSVESKIETSVAQDPMNNPLFEVVAQVQSEEPVSVFDSYNYEYPDGNYYQCRIVHTVLGYDGIVTKEYVTDYMDYMDAWDVMDTLVPEEDPWQYNDGLKLVNWEEIEQPYAYTDINGVYYIFSDPVWWGYGLSYNLGLMQESWREQVYVPGEDLPDWGDNDTFIYTVFSDDVNYLFPKTEITTFDDNGYAVMAYQGKQYVIRLKQRFITSVVYNGEKICFDQLPTIENGRTLVPLRAIFEKIGAEVLWNGETRTVTATKDDVSVSLTIDETTAYKNGAAITLDVPAKIVNGRTLVPVRFVADCFGVSVDWIQETRTVVLNAQ